MKTKEIYGFGLLISNEIGYFRKIFSFLLWRIVQLNKLFTNKDDKTRFFKKRKSFEIFSMNERIHFSRWFLIFVATSSSVLDYIKVLNKYHLYLDLWWTRENISVAIDIFFDEYRMEIIHIIMRLEPILILISIEKAPSLAEFNLEPISIDYLIWMELYSKRIVILKIDYHCPKLSHRIRNFSIVFASSRLDNRQSFMPREALMLYRWKSISWLKLVEMRFCGEVSSHDNCFWSIPDH